MSYDEPEIREADFAELPAWNAVIAAGYQPGTDPQEWERDEDPGQEPGL